MTIRDLRNLSGVTVAFLVCLTTFPRTASGSAEAGVSVKLGGEAVFEVYYSVVAEHQAPVAEMMSDPSQALLRLLVFVDKNYELFSTRHIQVRADFLAYESTERNDVIIFGVGDMLPDIKPVPIIKTHDFILDLEKAICDAVGKGCVIPSSAETVNIYQCAKECSGAIRYGNIPYDQPLRFGLRPSWEGARAIKVTKSNIGVFFSILGFE